jgi:hypothetical protein
MMIPKRYAWCNPYVNSQAERYGKHFDDIYGKRIIDEKDLLEKLASQPEFPDILMFWSFCRNRAGIVSQCRERGINPGFWEDGFFPHYRTLHFDPLGFCWESSLTRMVFRGVSEGQRARARAAREAWLKRPSQPLPDGVRKPFVLWPLQLIGDQVNVWDLGVMEWTGLLKHFRASLPPEIQLVLKDHPGAKEKDTGGLDALLPQLRNSVRLPKEANLTALLHECSAVAGANSSVLSEGRLMFGKPAYAYGRSWFTNHSELFFPLRTDSRESLPRLEWIENPSRMRCERLDDYADWFLAQLLGRQLESKIAECDPEKLKQKMGRLSHRSFMEHGEEIFEGD